LWEGSSWKAIGLGDVIDPKKVKLNYRKAMLVVHPDRASNQSMEVKFIAKRVFEAINDAYQDFLKKEGLDS
jgi:DnaJ-domain-containing protein 1